MAAYARERGAILVGRDAVAESVKVDDEYKFQRTYAEPFKYAPITGYFSYYSQTGVEQSENPVLSGDDSLLFVTRLVDLLSNDAPKGGSVELTINKDAQDAAVRRADRPAGAVRRHARGLGRGAGAQERQDPGHGLPADLRPQQAGQPRLRRRRDDYDRLSADESEPLLNRGIQTTLPPGSTFKIVTAAAAIESGRYDASDLVPGGPTYQLPQTSGDTGLIDNEGRECGSTTVSFETAMGNSCNTTFAQLAVDVGADALKETAEGFGFNSRYLDDLGPQAVSVFPEDANPPQTGQSGIGQFEVRSTPLQMAMVVAGIANQGTVMRPYIVDEVQSPELEVLQKTEPSELSQAVSASTASELTKLLTYTVDNGTAEPAQIKGVKVAGKTGTAQSGQDDVPPYAWFVSFAPADDDPQVAVAVMIQRIDGVERGEIAGGQLGGPIAKAVMEAVIK